MGLCGVLGRSEGGEATRSGEFPLGLRRYDDKERSRREGGGGERCRRNDSDTVVKRRNGGKKTYGNTKER